MKYTHYFICALLLICSQQIYAESIIKGRVYYTDTNRNYAISNVQVSLIGSNESYLTGQGGEFVFQIADGEDKISALFYHRDFLPRILTVYVGQNNEIEMTSLTQYYSLLNITGPIRNSRKIFINGVVSDANNNIPISGCLVRLVESPYFTITDNFGNFQFEIPVDVIKFSAKKDYWIITEKKEYESTTHYVSRDSLLLNRDSNFEFHLYGYYPSSYIEDLKRSIDEMKLQLDLNSPASGSEPFDVSQSDSLIEAKVKLSSDSVYTLLDSEFTHKFELLTDSFLLKTQDQYSSKYFVKIDTIIQTLKTLIEMNNQESNPVMMSHPMDSLSSIKEKNREQFQMGLSLFLLNIRGRSLDEPLPSLMFGVDFFVPNKLGVHFRVLPIFCNKNKMIVAVNYQYNISKKPYVVGSLGVGAHWFDHKIYPCGQLTTDFRVKKFTQKSALSVSVAVTESILLKNLMYAGTFDLFSLGLKISL